MLQWKTQISTPPVSETSYKIKKASEKNIKRFYQEKSQTIQFVHKQNTTAADLPKVPTALTLKWLTDKLVSVEMSSEIRKLIDTRTVGTGVAKYSTI